MMQTFKKHQQFNIKIPSYSELWVKKFYSSLKVQHILKRYLPDYIENTDPEMHFLSYYFDTFSNWSCCFCQRGKKEKHRAGRKWSGVSFYLSVNENEIDNLLVHPSIIICI